MIRTSYIHEFDMYDEVLHEINLNEAYADQLVNEYNLLREQHDLKTFIESSDEESYVLENAAKDAVTKIGEFVTNIINKVIELVQKVSKTFNEMLWNKKSDAQKLEAICKKHPTLAKDISFAIRNGDLDIKDVKSMQDLMDGSYDILQKLNAGKIEPTEAEKRFDKVMTKWNKYGKPICEVVIVIGGAIGGLKAIGEFYPNLMKNRIESKKMKAQLDELEVQGKMEARKANGGEEVGIARVKNKIISTVCSKLTKNLNAQDSLYSRFANWVSSSLHKLESSQENDEAKLKKAQNASDRITKVTNRGQVLTQKEIQDNADKLTRERDAINRANNNADEAARYARNRTDSNADEAARYARNRTDSNADEAARYARNRADSNNDARGKSYETQMGRHEADDDWRRTHPQQNNNGRNNRRNNRRNTH